MCTKSIAFCQTCIVISLGESKRLILFDLILKAIEYFLVKTWTNVLIFTRLGKIYYRCTKLKSIFDPFLIFKVTTVHTHKVCLKIKSHHHTFWTYNVSTYDKQFREIRGLVRLWWSWLYFIKIDLPTKQIFISSPRLNGGRHKVFT